MNNTKSDFGEFLDGAKELFFMGLTVLGVLFEIIGCICEGAAIASFLDD